MKILATNFKHFFSEKVTGKNIFNKNRSFSTQIRLDTVLFDSLEFPTINNL
jgi:hypothetical protein